MHHDGAGQRAYLIVSAVQEQQRHRQARQPTGQALHRRQDLGPSPSFDPAPIHQRVLPVGADHLRVPADFVIGIQSSHSEIGNQRREHSCQAPCQRRTGRRRHCRPGHHHTVQRCAARSGRPVVGRPTVEGTPLERIVQRDKATERVAHHEDRQAGMALGGEPHEGPEVLQDQRHPFDIGAPPVGLSVPAVIGGVDRVARRSQPGADVRVACRVLMNPVHYDDDRSGRIPREPGLPVRRLPRRVLPVPVFMGGDHELPPQRARPPSCGI
jgi:hypothetical protein